MLLATTPLIVPYHFDHVDRSVGRFLGGVGMRERRCMQCRPLKGLHVVPCVARYVH